MKDGKNSIQEGVPQVEPVGGTPRTMKEQNIRNALGEPLQRILSPTLPPSDQAVPIRIVSPFVRAVYKFWEHGDLFAGAAISFYALFSLLPLTVLLLTGLQFLFPGDRVMRGMGRLFGLADTDVVLRTIRGAFSAEGSMGWFGIATLVLAATGVFAALQVALDRVWECRGRIFHIRFSVGVLTMVVSLLIFLGVLVGTFFAFRFIRTSVVGGWLGWPRTPPRGTGNALSIATALAQFGIFWAAYRFLPNVPVRWRDAFPGALLASVIWHPIAYGLSWYLASIADYNTLYHSMSAVVVLLVWVYGLSCTFLLGAEFVAQRTLWPQGRGAAQWLQPVQAPSPGGQGPPPAR
jgi:membrane protein